MSGFCGGENLAALNLFLNQPSAECVFQDDDTFLKGAGEVGGEKMVIPSSFFSATLRALQTGNWHNEAVGSLASDPVLGLALSIS